MHPRQITRRPTHMSRMVTTFPKLHSGQTIVSATDQARTLESSAKPKHNVPCHHAVALTRCCQEDVAVVLGAGGFGFLASGLILPGFA